MAQATQNVTLQGTLSPTGDVATTASILQSGVLGDAQYSAPTTTASLTLASPPNATGITSQGQAGTGAMGTGQYQYEFVYADGPYNSSPPATESSPSAAVTAHVAAGQNQVQLDSIPAPNAANNYNYVRVYRTAAGGSTFYYDGEVNLTNTPAPASFTDTLDDTSLQANPQLNTNELDGNYSYYVTFANETGGPPNGQESRPTPLAGPLNVVNGRIQLTNLPTAPAGSGWVCERASTATRPPTAAPSTTSARSTTSPLPAPSPTAPPTRPSPTTPRSTSTARKSPPTPSWSTSWSSTAPPIRTSFKTVRWSSPARKAAVPWRPKT